MFPMCGTMSGGGTRRDRSPEGVRVRSYRSPEGGRDKEFGNCETERDSLKQAINSLSVMVAC